MKNLLILMVLGLGLFRMEAKADEGMWIPMFIDRLNYERHAKKWDFSLQQKKSTVLIRVA